MADSHPKSKFRKEHNHSNVIPFGHKDGQKPYIHDVKAFLKQNARERADNTVTISDPDSDAGLCTKCGEPAPIEYAYTVPFGDDPELRAKVVQAFCANDWLSYIEQEFLPRIHRTGEEA